MSVVAVEHREAMKAKATTVLTTSQNLMEVYEKFQDSRKWVLSTEKVVEDALTILKCSYEQYVVGYLVICVQYYNAIIYNLTLIYFLSTSASHSFIFDPTDQSYIKEGIFTEEELYEIKTYKRCNLLEVPEELLGY